MKKIFKFLIVNIIFVINLVGCSNIDEEYNNNSLGAGNNKSITVLDDFDDFARVHSVGLEDVLTRFKAYGVNHITPEIFDSILAESVIFTLEDNSAVLDEIKYRYNFSQEDVLDTNLISLFEQYLSVNIFYDLEMREDVFYSKDELLKRILLITEMESFNKLDLKSQKIMLMSFSVLLDSYFYWHEYMQKWRAYLDGITLEGQIQFKGVGADAQFYGNTYNASVATADAKGAVGGAGLQGTMSAAGKFLNLIKKIPGVGIVQAAAVTAVYSSSGAAFGLNLW